MSARINVRNGAIAFTECRCCVVANVYGWRIGKHSSRSTRITKQQTQFQSIQFILTRPMTGA
eukprot:4848524-Pleurochrysis_carterae.AAC.1